MVSLPEAFRGPAFMTLAMGCFALEDMFLKAAMAEIEVGLGLVIFGLGGMAMFALWARLRSEHLFHPAYLTRPMILRSLSEVGGRLFYTLAFVLAPLTLVSAILQATPLVVALGAVVIFGERVGWRRWAAIALGFAGVLIILRPGAESIPLSSVFAVLGMLGFAFRDLATRASPASMSTAQLGLLGFAMLVVAGLIMVGITGPGPLPRGNATIQLVLATLAGVAAYSALTRAMRVGEVSLTVPWRYTRLLFAIALGVLIFGERPDATTLIGASIIVSSGIYTLHRAAKA